MIAKVKATNKKCHKNSDAHAVDNDVHADV